jgi:TfoX/Sxy family transcriptional regulator of competence genes
MCIRLRIFLSLFLLSTGQVGELNHKITIENNMAYDELLAEKIRLYFITHNVENREIKMMGGLCFMVDDKMCVGVIGSELMARINPDIYEQSVAKNGCNEMKFTGRPMKGFVIVNLEEVDAAHPLDYWIQLCLDYNPLAKSSRKKKRQPK